MTRDAEASRAADAVDPAGNAREFVVHPSAVSSDTASPSSLPGAAGPETDATLLKELEESYRADHHYANIADHPAMKDRVDRDAEGVIEPIAARFAELRARVATLEARLQAAERDTERLDFMASITGDVDQVICPPGNHGGGAANWLLTHEYPKPPFAHEWEALTLRETIDLARAAPRGDAAP